MSPSVTLIVPVFNEQDNIQPLYQQLRPVMDQIGDVELVIVDDGSTDATPERLQEIVARDRRVVVVQFRRNYGQTAAMQAGPLGYTVSLGLPELRAGIAALYKRWYGVDLNPDRVIVTSGSSGAFLLAFTALFDAGDRVGLGEPGYPSYRQILRALSLEPVGIPTSDANRLQPVPADLAGIDMQGLIVASPGNPSGTMLSRDHLAGLMQAAHSRDIAFISDEIYHGLHYADRATSALEISDQAYVINSFSKYFSMTGWRLGWLVLPPALVEPVERLAQNLYICPSAVAQHAALGCFEAETLALCEQRRGELQRRRDRVLAGLARVGLPVPVTPDGAFYAWADCSAHPGGSWELCHGLLERAHVVLTPGRDFGPSQAERFLRLSFAGAADQLDEAIERLARALEAPGPVA